MTSDRFTEQFGVTDEELYDHLAELQKRLTKAKGHYADGGDLARIESIFESLNAVESFLFMLPCFRDKGLIEPISLAAHDVDRALKGSPPINIAPMNSGGRPKDSNVVQILKGWCAAYMELLRRTGLTIPLAAEKAARDINNKGWRFPIGRSGEARVTPGRIKSWRSDCVGKVHPNELIYGSYLLTLLFADSSGLHPEATARKVLEQANSSDFRHYLHETD